MQFLLKIKHNFRLILVLTFIFTVVVLVILEVFSILLIKKMGWNYDPAYLRLIKGYTKSNLIGGRTEYHSWGSWNVPNYTGRIADNCFDVTYKFNSYGARDKERSKKGKNRTLVFGDSYTEGWGVDQDKILAADLERLSGRQYLNFGVAGSGSGGLNEYILYRDFGSKFEHDAVMVGFFPGNDFTDNDPAVWQGLTKDYYRPFWQLTPDKKDIEIKYYAPQIKGKYLLGLEPQNKKAYFKTYDNWKEFSAFLNLLTVLKNHKITFSNQTTIPYARKLNVSDDEIKANLIVYDKFSQLIGNKKKYIYIVPSGSDVIQYKESGNKKIAKFENFKKELTKQGWTVIDLIDVFAKVPDKDLPSYFICDGHWSAKGDELVAEYLNKKLQK
jgi:hypothetical protein